MSDEFNEYWHSVGSTLFHNDDKTAVKSVWECAQTAALAKREAVAEVPKDSPQSFITYMKKNYPPDTIIQDGAWHARAIWGAARYTMLAASQQAAKGEGT